MPSENAISANHTSWPKGFGQRLTQFAERTRTTPPEPFTGEGENRTFSTEFLGYCKETGLSLDWVCFGDPMGLVMQAHNVAKNEAEKATFFEKGSGLPCGCSP